VGRTEPESSEGLFREVLPSLVESRNFSRGEGWRGTHVTNNGDTSRVEADETLTGKVTRCEVYEQGLQVAQHELYATVRGSLS